MRKLSLLVLFVLVATGFAMAQGLTYKGGADVLGAHNGYGRGCVMCHAPHSGVLGNGKATTSDPENGVYALWGQDLTPLYGKTFNFSGDDAANLCRHAACGAGQRPRRQHRHSLLLELP